MSGVLTGQTEKSTYREYLSLASVVSALAVIYLHVNSCFWEFSATERYWRSANVIECTFYFAVPVFFMISGANLLDFFDRYGLKVYFQKRFGKTVIPYFFWSIFGLIYQLYVKKNLNPAAVDIKYVIKGLLDGSIVGIYWYFPALFTVYLSLPLFAAVAKERRQEVFLYLACAGFFLNSLIPLIIRILNLNAAFPYSVTAVSGYLIYLPLGWLLSHLDFSFGKRVCAYFSGIVGLLLQIYGTKILSYHAGQIVDTYKGYFNVPCLMASVGVFLFIRYGLAKILKIQLFQAMIRGIARYTFGIYLIHIYVLWTILLIVPVNIHSIIYRSAAPPVIFLISMGCIFLIRLIPGAKRILP